MNHYPELEKIHYIILAQKLTRRKNAILRATYQEV